jgi:hypothetical protein
MPVVEQHTLTPPELARRWRVKPERVIVWIKSGELRAFDVSSRPGVVTRLAGDSRGDERFLRGFGEIPEE